MAMTINTTHDFLTPAHKAEQIAYEGLRLYGMILHETHWPTFDIARLCVDPSSCAGGKGEVHRMEHPKGNQIWVFHSPKPPNLDPKAFTLKPRTLNPNFFWEGPRQRGNSQLWVRQRLPQNLSGSIRKVYLDPKSRYGLVRLQGVESRVRV